MTSVFEEFSLMFHCFDSLRIWVYLGECIYVVIVGMVALILLQVLCSGVAHGLEGGIVPTSRAG